MPASSIGIGDDMLFHWVASNLEIKGEMENLEKVKQLQGASKLYLPIGTFYSISPSYCSISLEGKTCSND